MEDGFFSGIKLARLVVLGCGTVDISGVAACLFVCAISAKETPALTGACASCTSA